MKPSARRGVVVFYPNRSAFLHRTTQGVSQARAGQFRKGFPKIPSQLGFKIVRKDGRGLGVRITDAPVPIDKNEGFRDAFQNALVLLFRCFGLVPQFSFLLGHFRAEAVHLYV